MHSNEIAIAIPDPRVACAIAATLDSVFSVFQAPSRARCREILAARPIGAVFTTRKGAASLLGLFTQLGLLSNRAPILVIVGDQVPSPTAIIAALHEAIDGAPRNIA